MRNVRSHAGLVDHGDGPEVRNQPMGHYLDEIFSQAHRRGDFDQLPGKGKPLPASAAPDPFGGPEAELYRALKEQNVRPEWVELQQQIRHRQYNKLAPPQLHLPTYKE